MLKIFIRIRCWKTFKPLTGFELRWQWPSLCLVADCGTGLMSSWSLWYFRPIGQWCFKRWPADMIASFHRPNDLVPHGSSTSALTVDMVTPLLWYHLLYDAAQLTDDLLFIAIWAQQPLFWNMAVDSSYGNYYDLRMLFSNVYLYSFYVKQILKRLSWLLMTDYKDLHLWLLSFKLCYSNFIGLFNLYLIFHERRFLYSVDCLLLYKIAWFYQNAV